MLSFKELQSKYEGKVFRTMDEIVLAKKDGYRWNIRVEGIPTSIAVGDKEIHYFINDIKFYVRHSNANITAEHASRFMNASQQKKEISVLTNCDYKDKENLWSSMINYNPN